MEKKKKRKKEVKEIIIVRHVFQEFQRFRTCSRFVALKGHDNVHYVNSVRKIYSEWKAIHAGLIHIVSTRMLLLRAI